jgi:hypothetical protein
MLDKLYSGLTFDPLAFTRMKPIEQLNILKEMLGLDFSAEERERNIFYNRRTEFGRQIKTLEGSIDRNPLLSAPDGEVLISELMDELETIEQHNDDLERQRRIRTTVIDGIESANQKWIRTEQDALGLEERAKKAIAAAQQMKKNLDKQNAELAEKQDIPMNTDTSATKEKIKQASEINERVLINRKIHAWMDELESLKKDSKEATKQIAMIDDAKDAKLGTTKFPIDGMSFGDECVMYEGVPFDQAGQGDEIRVSMAMGIAMHPELHILLIRHGSLIDEDNTRLIKEMADEHGIQCWIEKVSEGKECTIILVDGMIKEDSNDDGGNEEVDR